MLQISSAANVGGDSLTRQQEAVRLFAKRQGLEIVGEFRDPGISGKDPIDTRAGFSALLDRIEESGVRTVLIEDVSRFARDLIVQELGVVLMIQRGVRVLTASGEDLTETNDPARVMIRQLAAPFAQYEKDWLVRKLRAARERRRGETGRCEGGKPVAPEAVAQAKRTSTSSLSSSLSCRKGRRPRRGRSNAGRTARSGGCSSPLRPTPCCRRRWHRRSRRARPARRRCWCRRIRRSSRSRRRDRGPRIHRPSLC